MNLNHLKTFVAIVDKGTLSAACEELHLTQPGVSKHLRALEEHYGVRLLDRTGRKVRLTSAGQVLYRSAKRILYSLDKAEKELAELAHLSRGELTLGASTTPGEYVVPKLISAFKVKHPQIGVSLKIGNTQEILTGVQEGELDLGVVGALVTSRRLIFFRLVSDEIVLIVPPSHRLAGLKEVTLTDLEGEAFIWREVGSGTRRVIEERLAAAGARLPLNIVMTLGSTEAIVKAVEAGLGISFVTRFSAQGPVELGRLAVLRVRGLDLRRQLFVVRRKKRQSPAAEAFWGFLEGAGYLSPDGL